VAIGDGVAATQRVGSEVHDAIYFDAERRYHRTTNRAGGLEGGVTNGQDVVIRAYMKPISTLRRGLPSVDIETREPHRSQWERSDVTAVPACASSARRCWRSRSRTDAGEIRGGFIGRDAVKFRRLRSSGYQPSKDSSADVADFRRLNRFLSAYICVSADRVLRTRAYRRRRRSH